MKMQRLFSLARRGRGKAGPLCGHSLSTIDTRFLLIAFVTQEPPCSNTESMGSLRYARRSQERGENIRVMLSMDAIGIYRQGPDTQKLPFPFSLFYLDRGNFLAFIADLGTRPHVVEATRGF